MRTAAAALLVVASLTGVGAQNASSAAPPAAEQIETYRLYGARIGIGRSIHVPVDVEVADAVVVVAGSARIDGRVRDGVVVVGGNLDLGPRADVRGEVVVVGGRIYRAPGAQLRGPVTDISVGDWSTWKIGGLSLPVVEFDGFGRWLTLFGTLFRVALLVVLMALVILVARAPVARIGRSAAAEPAKSFVIGLAAEVLFLPALVIGSVALIVTIIGIPLVALLVPVAVFGAFVALVLGFTALACRIGEWLEDRVGLRAHSALLATTLGLLLVVGPTIIARIIGVTPAPFRWAGIGLLITGILIEFVVWTIGLGATLMTGFGRWSTAPPPPPITQPSIVPATN